MDDSQVVDKDQTIQKLSCHVERAKSPELQITLVSLEIDERGNIVEQWRKVRIERAVYPEAVEKVLKGEVAELHLDAEASLDGRIAWRSTSFFNLIPCCRPHQRIWGVCIKEGRVYEPWFCNICVSDLTLCCAIRVNNLLERGGILVEVYEWRWL